MGEITEALRRARELRAPPEEASAPERTPPAPRAREVLPPPAPLVPPGRAPLAAAAAEDRKLYALHPNEPAIVVAQGAYAEACRNVGVQIRSELARRRFVSAAIVSAVAGEGKTTVMCDLGIALASFSPGRDVAVIDLDLRKPSVAKAFGLEPEVGIESLLAGQATLDDVRMSIEHPGFDFYPAVQAQRAPHELYARPSFTRMIAELEQRYAILLVDTPPALLFPDAGLILREVDAYVPVARAGYTRMRSFGQLLKTLPASQAMGGLLNDTRMPTYTSYYGRYDRASAEPSAPLAGPTP